MSAHPTATSTRGARSRVALWLPGLAVAIGAAVATAHGLFEVAVAARVPVGVAWIYPLITDGLALVAYGATARLRGSGARYAWAVVIVSAGLSGLAQAVYLASDTVTTGGALEVSPALRFGVGAWPAIAAAVVAHLLYLLAADHPADTDEETAGERNEGNGASRPRVPMAITVPRDNAASPSHSDSVDPGPGVPPALDGPVIPAPPRPVSQPSPRPVSRPGDGAGAGAQERARTTAQHHCDTHGALPTVRELQDLAQVGRGTAARALQQLRDHPPQATSGLHLVPDEPHDRTQP
ncbi:MULTISPECIES: hypothetical protein [Pseudonocardia]|uniref:DUF2637 domain-containing protein n=2 Tax=Pseudonocardia TaxID=1847 RepID=A0A1Y2MJ18_PSEAH|nr:MULTISPECIES: hypothetical protein [Pseudonocardia]OSY34989.1 hypothetical protein BG845_06372 [Pseudonocardia autotrophica]TDN73195.1 hypothetical protein C8E95_2279 [Pseudonocardia autotrophica]BBG03925.1 hypothetical protein Pdca_51340 [Pseudonocardia autotrophica]GEC28309.1 hypothetical protein PSA01_53380 [Pseudonocardia saturnea]